MSQLATIGSTTVGIDGPSTMIVQGSSTVMIDGISATTIGSPIVPHKKYGSKSAHGGVVASGSGTIMIEGKAAAMVGQSFVTCGDQIGTSLSTTVQGT